jgi:catechol 2,3-dioxygenase-like lactoylglutathione lyase family enzyme
MHESPGITRRELMFALPAIFVAHRGLAQQPAPIVMNTLNHVHLTVSNLQRSLDFYQKVFDLPLAGMQGVEADWQKPVVPMLAIGDGPQFISFSEGTGKSAGRDRINHFGFGMDRFDARRVVGMLAAHGLKSDLRMRADSTPAVAELKFNDPEGIIVQIQDRTYCGGSGALGSRCRNRPAQRTAGAAPIPVRTLNHMTLAVSDVPRARDFYERVLGMRLRFAQGTEADWSKKVIPIIGFANGPQFLAFSGSRDGSRIDHFCFGMDGFNAGKVVDMLAAHGLKATVRKRADTTPPTEELMTTDPDGIKIQIQDSTYCGGGGVLGDRCNAV